MAKKFSEKANDAIGKLSWDALKKHLDSVVLAINDVVKLVGLVQRSEPLVLKHVDEKKELNRDNLLAELAGYLDVKGFPNQAQLVRAHAGRLKEIDSVYHTIFATLKNTEASKQSPELRVSAAIKASNQGLIDVIEQVNAETIANGRLDFGKVTAQGGDGKKFSPGAYHEGLVQALANTLGMEAHINGWFNRKEKGILVLPTLPEPSEEDLSQVVPVQYLAHSWSQWQFSERRHRYLGAPLVRVADSDGRFESVWQSYPNDDYLELYSLAANLRLMERFKQSYMPITTAPWVQSLVAGINGEVELFPKQVVSVSEVHGAHELGDVLSTDIEDHKTEYAGLTLAEWIRGYSVLKAVSESAIDTGNAHRMSLHFSETELVAMLQRLGLHGPKAQVFIGHATYRSASRDLFDQPLIKLNDGRYMLLALAAGASSIPKVVLSTLGMLEVTLETRGKRFEASMIKLLQRHGFNAKNIESTKDGSTYDYDVAFVWGDYLFLLECKSRSLPTSDPARIYYYSHTINDVVTQVKRLNSGLNKYPEILSTHMPEAVGKKVVFCVVNSLPFSTFTEDGEIHFADAGGIARFFKQSELCQLKLDSNTGERTQNPLSIYAQLWDGERPTPEDFLRYLRSPIQLAHAMYHMEIKQIDILMGVKVALQVQDYQDSDKTIESLREASRQAGYRTVGDVETEQLQQI